jgi:hypothetical protein
MCLENNSRGKRETGTERGKEGKRERKREGGGRRREKEISTEYFLLLQNIHLLFPINNCHSLLEIPMRTFALYTISLYSETKRY